MKALLTSVITLALGGLFLLPETAVAASSATSAATAASATTTIAAHGFSWGNSRRPARKIKKSRHHSSAARAHAKRNRRASF